NMVVVEHRYFGSSIPEKPDWKYCTTEQSANDCHVIREFVAKFFKGKWLLYGTGKGGQMALAYKMKFPDDTDASVIMGAAVRNSDGDTRLDEFFTAKSATKCGQYIEKYQKEMLDRKQTMMPVFSEFIAQKKLSFEKSGLDPETLYDYCVLYYPLCFWQGGFSCIDIPIPDSPEHSMVRELVKVINPRFFSNDVIDRLRASQYMAYAELGAYEPNTTPFKGKLKKKDYSNKLFLPQGTKPKYNGKFYEQLNAFLKKSKAKNMLFIYGENDPWASMQAEINAENNNKKLIIANGSNKSRLSELKPEQIEELAKFVGDCLGVNLKSK
ncbi:MAG TPA: S28 family serine protease, partial [Flavobacteriales bacterium]|nr:S28 family serine protease [Flavobacteriales bacterium]